MNERIWQLQGQAKVLAEEIVSQRKYDDYMEYKQSLMDHTMKKFAELIVGECVEIFNDDSDNLVFEIHNKISRDKIKKHFGVEE